MCFGAMPRLADNPHCRQVGGGVLTNFLAASSRLFADSRSPVNLCTDGTTTGDLRGAIGVQVPGITGNVYHNIIIG